MIANRILAELFGKAKGLVAFLTVEHPGLLNRQLSVRVRVEGEVEECIE